LNLGSVCALAATLLVPVVAPAGEADTVLDEVLVTAQRRSQSAQEVGVAITAVSGVRDTDAGVASATLNVGQQVGGSIGLAVLATAAAIASRNATSSTIAALRTRVNAGQLPANVIPHVRDLIAARSGATPTTAALHDGTALHAVAQIQAQARIKPHAVRNCGSLRPKFLLRIGARSVA